MDKKIKAVKKAIDKGMNNLVKADKKRDKVCEYGEKQMKKAR